MNRLLDDDIVTALGAILDTAPAPAVRPSVSEAAEAGSDMVLLPGLQPRRVRRGGLVLVAAVSLVAVGGLAVLNRRSSTIVFSQSSTSVADSIEPTPVTTQATTTTTVASPSKYTGWYLPTFIPTGYETTSIDASHVRSGENQSGPSPQKWVRRNAAGIITGMLFVATSVPPAPEPGKEASPNATVRGLPASVFDSGEGIVVGWEESGTAISVRGDGLSEAETRSIADGASIDAATGVVSVSPGGAFIRIEAPPVAENVVGVNISWLRSDGRNAGNVGFSTSSTEGNTLEMMKWTLDQRSGGSTAVIERHGAFDRLVTRMTDDLGTIATVEWIQDGFLMYVAGRASGDDVVKMAESIQPVDPSRFVDEGRGITERVLARPTLEQARFADGTVVSVKARDGNPIGLCVEAPVAVCRWHVSEGSLLGQQQAGVFDTFDVAGRTLVLGWHEGSVEPTQTVNTIPGSEPESSSGFAEVKRTPLGSFVEVVLRDGEKTPGISYGGMSYGIADRPNAETTLLHY
jgi:hypothetical protein